MALSTLPNRALWVLKWPCAVSALISLPLLLMATTEPLMRRGVSLWSDPRCLIFIGGAVSYAVLWRLLFRRRFMGSFFSTLEHELTHAIFAWLTLHRVTGLKSSWNSGGEITVRGGHNWLIFIGPYWFPTLSVIVMLLMTLTSAPPLILSGILGLTFSYHLTSTWRETHAQQTDLQQVRFLFAWLILPSANLLSFGVTIAFALEGPSGVTNFFTDFMSLWSKYYF